MSRKSDPLPTRIGRFTGEWGFLSNMSPVEVKLCIDHLGIPWAGLTGDAVSIEEYASVEHGLQAAKFLDPKIREKFRIPGLDPKQAKGFAANLRQRGLVRGDWKQVSVEILHGLLVQKYTYSILRRKLLSTFTAQLIEGNWWHDNFYGDCLCPECESTPGLNILGRLQMAIRDGKPMPLDLIPSSDPSTS